MIEFCKNCIMPNSRPRIEFNKDGICNACTNYVEKKNINWTERKELFLNKIYEIKNNLVKFFHRKRKSQVLFSKFRRIWTRNTAIGSPFFGWLQGTSSVA